MSEATSLTPSASLSVTDCRIRMVAKGGLLATAEIVLGGAISIREVKIVALPNGKVIVSMPYRRLFHAKCGGCGSAIERWFVYCPGCAAPAPACRVPKAKCYSDVVSIVEDSDRKRIEGEVLAEYMRVFRGGASNA
jgi:DNA-binding cell septation regulator SpoVG